LEDSTPQKIVNFVTHNSSYERKSASLEKGINNCPKLATKNVKNSVEVNESEYKEIEMKNVRQRGKSEDRASSRVT
jgi:hypothetical protein